MAFKRFQLAALSMGSPFAVDEPKFVEWTPDEEGALDTGRV
jgi:hypothetical protein